MISVLIFGCLWWSSQNPDDREIGHSNVLVFVPPHLLWPSCIGCDQAWSKIGTDQQILSKPLEKLSEAKKMYLFVNYLDVSVSTLEWGEEQWTKEHLSKSTGTLQIEMIVSIGLKWIWNWKLFGFVVLRQLIEEYRREWRRSRGGCNNYFLIYYFFCNIFLKFIMSFETIVFWFIICLQKLFSNQ